MHLLQVLAPLKRVQRSYKSSVESKSKSCVRGRVNSCGGTAGGAPFGEGERDQRVSSCSCFVWIHLAPSLAGVTNVVNNCLPRLLSSPPVFSAVVSSDSESDSEFSSSSLDDKPLSARSKGSQGRKHRAGLGEELLFLWLEGGKCQVLECLALGTVGFAQPACAAAAHWLQLCRGV